MDTPSPKYICPRCLTAHVVDSAYCGTCGANMQRASALDSARGSPTEPGMATQELADADRPRIRRFSDREDPWLGRVIDGRYRVDEVIGRGGMGMVYRVEHLRMGKIAAMKVLHHELADDPEVIGRFRREAEAVSMLNHPNTVQVFDFGTARGALYLIMEYVRGRDLNAVVKRDGPLPLSRAAPLFGQVCGAVAEAHERGVIHRDLKPENVLVTRTQRGRDFVKVLDFGLAKLSERDEQASEVTDRGAIVGTPYFMSPEQIRGDEVDARTDIYSLGALMYRVLTGTHPFTAKTPVGVLTKHLTAPLEPPSVRAPALDIPDEADRILARAMAKDRGDRYATIGEMMDDLEALARDGAVSVSLAGPATTPARSDTGGSRRPVTDTVDYGIDSAVRLRRSDLDAFEASLRRRRWLRIALVPLLLVAAGAAGAYFLVLRPAAPQRVEREPNDHLVDATLIATAREVTGYLGKRISPTQPDRDYFRVAAVPGVDGAGAVSAAVTPPPNIDVALSLVDALGNPLVRVDEAGVGAREVIRDRRMDGIVYVLVTEAFEGDRLPVENVSDTYSLSVTRTPLEPGVESEPNDSAGDAIALAPGAPVAGHLDRRADVDTFQLAADGGSYQVEIRGAADVPLQWRVGSGLAQTERRVVVTMERGALLRLERGDADRPHGAPLPGADQPYVLEVTPAEPSRAPDATPAPSSPRPARLGARPGEPGQPDRVDRPDPAQRPSTDADP